MEIGEDNYFYFFGYFTFRRVRADAGAHRLPARISRLPRVTRTRVRSQR